MEICIIFCKNSFESYSQNIKLRFPLKDKVILQKQITFL